ncbi:phage repressor protein/antirepressor Ant [Planococcus sp. ANT_H30]|uniref:phage antirepressor n=1 Tax=Planococcus sp. ANT_H30 TaxID=2597347 RepID=UPI0011EC1124|nr:phage antirepressor KilAC domain-containing protein [Planococcus sp. ANT_H30]KAA0956671.1 phage repressor protein/antirepressor Ant [Planococcus sp. ANT_H30]
MNDLKVFNHNNFGTLNILVIDEKVHFPANEIAKKLGYSNSSDAINRHCKNEGVVFHEVLTTGGKQKKKFINEGNLYRLITNSKLPEAERFESWVFDEVVPSIRKHGAYMTPETIEKALLDPDTIIQIATQLKEERLKRQQAELTVQEQKPKVLFADSVEASKSSILIRELAVLLKQNGINTGERRLYEWMRENGYLVRRHGSDRNTPTQRSMNLGLFEIKETPINHNSGLITVNKTTKVTGKGQVYFINKFLTERLVV